MLTDAMGDPLPLGYGQVLAGLAGYEAASISGAESYWRGPTMAAKTPYQPGLYADINRLRYYGSHATFTLYLMSADPGGITCRMLGDAIPDDELFRIIAAWANLPYARQVSEALIDQADWLDAHPAYRGVPIAGQVAARRLAPGHHEVAP